MYMCIYKYTRIYICTLTRVVGTLEKAGAWFELQLGGGLSGERVLKLMLLISTAGYLPISRV